MSRDTRQGFLAVTGIELMLQTMGPRKSIILPVVLSVGFVVATVMWVRSYSARSTLVAFGQGDTEYLLVSGRGSVQMLRHWPWDESQTEVAWTVAWWQVNAILGLLCVGCLCWHRLSKPVLPVARAADRA